ncbi:FAD-dependent oxidoreductase [Pseudomonas panipatensis]|uniref:Succinate dehydrogenase/fumarate reductase, flavoprotein subunit n=1 Tax=Pseudomonas panipatensis TaxID=428992 RepID=A0A1G8IFS5_9PSED|nr:FAD-dependent oxidoreductase [Pseudomonas panipatensis]SDI17390.1 Succinate dehydrogenase/fumarate reductase, flavoprotein subunit [Pseudomonas panipatensis]SMP74179.1 Succinate dehydrogenase/fumarate reductase, flavoprotein subunit [Pseudomonas panipatensis]
MQQTRILDCDVLVIGSGAAGLAAAVTAAHHGLTVIVAEKASQLGGTSAWSGGWLWIPRNPLAVAEGLLEEGDAPERYLRAQTQRDVLDERQRAFLQHGPAMVEFFQRHTAVRFVCGSRMPDMHEGDGAVRGGRSLCAQPFDGRLLGPWIDKLRAPLDIVSLAGMGIAGGADMANFFNASRSPRAALYVAGRLLRHTRDLLRHGRGMHLVNGNALVARLLRSALDLGVSLLTEAPANALLRADGRVCGARLAGGLEVRARRGVVLACGGFPHDTARIAEWMPHAPNGVEHRSAAPAQNSGDGLRLGEAVGAQLSGELAHAGAWAPVSLVPRGDGTLGHFPHLIDRAKPGFLAVRRDGRRFCNEADCYHDFMNALFRATPAGEPHEAWLICDRQARRRYGIGWAKPWPFPAAWYERRGYLFKGRDLAELADRCGIDAERLAASVARFNEQAARGEDPDFQRGASAYNKAQGEPLNRPNPSLRALRQGPFYAVKLLPGSLGTFAGLCTDASARVLDARQQPIAGLFAVGNDMASVMAGHYPSGGITLGPGMTFGYLAGLALARQSDRPVPAAPREPCECATPQRWM